MCHVCVYTHVSYVCLWWLVAVGTRCMCATADLSDVEKDISSYHVMSILVEWFHHRTYICMYVCMYVCVCVCV